MQMLVVYAKDLKEGFAEYAPSITKIMVPHLKFFFHELVRAAAAEILPHLLECVRSKGKGLFSKMLSGSCDSGKSATAAFLLLIQALKRCRSCG